MNQTVDLDATLHYVCSRISSILLRFVLGLSKHL